jgi:putative ABC transport system substrate-binding protein
MMQKKILSFVLFWLGACGWVEFSWSCVVSSGEKPKIAIHQWIQHPALDRTVEGLLDGLRASGITEDQWTVQSAQGNAALGRQVALQLMGSRPSVVVAVGTGSAQALQGLVTKQPTPMLFLSVTDPVGSRLVEAMERAPGACVTGLSNFVPSDRAFATIRKIFPSLSRLGMIVNPGEPNSVAMSEDAKRAAGLAGLQLEIGHATKTADAAQVTHHLASRAVEAIFISNDNTALSAFSVITKVALGHGIPVFVTDTDIAEQGALAAIGPDQYQLGQEAADWIRRMLEGEPVASFAPSFPSRISVVWNASMAKRLSIVLPEGWNPDRVVGHP